MLLTQLWFININPTIYRLQQQPMHVCIFKYILLLPVLKLQPIGSPYSKLWRNSRRYTLLECWRFVQYFTKFNDLTFLPKTAYVLLLQNMNQCLTVAINSDLARLIRVKPRHVTVPWSYAEEGILTVTIKRRRKTQTLTDCIWFFFNLASYQHSNGRICQSIFRRRSWTAALFQRVRNQSVTLNE